MKNKTNTRANLFLLLLTGSLFIIFSSACKRCDRETITDIDGNVYHSLNIGTQVWMVENLKVTRYQNGDLLPNVTDTTEWCHLPTGAYCNYNNDIKNAPTYGRLYNWFAVTDSRNIAPKGWHVPTYREIEIMIAFLGGDTLAAGKLKEQGTSHWLYPNTGATNESGFTSLPGGYRYNREGTFHTLGSNGYWWTTTQSIELYTWSKRIFWYFAHADYNHNLKTLGFSVRCVRD